MTLGLKNITKLDLSKESQQKLEISKSKKYFVCFKPNTHFFSVYFLGELIYKYEFPIKIQNVSFSFSEIYLVINSHCFVFVFNIFSKQIEFTHEEKNEIDRAYMTKNGFVLIETDNKLVTLKKDLTRNSMPYEKIEVTKKGFILYTEERIYFMDSDFSLKKTRKLSKLPKIFFSYSKNRILSFDAGKFLAKNKKVEFLTESFEKIEINKKFIVILREGNLSVYTKGSFMKVFETIECLSFYKFVKNSILVVKTSGVFVLDMLKYFQSMITKKHIKIFDEFADLGIYSGF